MITVMKLIDFCKKNILLIWCFFTGLLILSFTTRSSVLFAYNNWDDVNSYFTMGKGMMNGMVIYRDLYDQKGPFLYLLYGICYLISNTSFFGVFLAEIAAATIFLYFAAKTITRHSTKGVAILLIPMLAAGVYSSKSFYWGGAAEEFCLPMFSYCLYRLDIMMHPSGEKKDIFSSKMFFVIGLMTGIAALIKYTMLGFFFGWSVIVVIIIITRKGLKSVFKPAIIYVSGIIIPIIPWLIYFGINGALDDWYRCYIYNNLFFYSNITGGTITLYEKFYKLAKLQYWLFWDNLEYFVWVIIGFIVALFIENGIVKKLAYLFIYATTFMFIFYGGGTLPYYSIPLMSLAIPGICYFGRFIQKIYESRLSKTMWYNITALVLILSLIYAKSNCLSTDYIKVKRSDSWLTEMASYIEEAPNTTLLNVGALDVGLYTITGIVPTCEYFQTNGIALPTMFDEQQRYINEGLTEYVIAGYYEPENIYDHYELINEVSFYDNSYDQTYYLYRHK